MWATASQSHLEDSRRRINYAIRHCRFTSGAIYRSGRFVQETKTSFSVEIDEDILADLTAPLKTANGKRTTFSTKDTSELCFNQPNNFIHFPFRQDFGTESGKPSVRRLYMSQTTTGYYRATGRHIPSVFLCVGVISAFYSSQFHARMRRGMSFFSSFFGKTNVPSQIIDCWQS